MRQSTAAALARQARDRLAAGPTAPAVAAPPPGATEAPSAPADGPPVSAPASRSRDGRYVLLGSVSLLGLGLYGPTLPVLAEPGSGQAAVGLYMLGAGGSFFAAYLATRDAPVSWGTTEAWVHGSTRGILHGLGVLVLVGGDDNNEKAILAGMSVGSLLEGTASAIWASSTNASAGLASAMSLGSDATGLVGMGLALTAVGGDISGRQLAAAGLLGSGAGYVLGHLYGAHRTPTWGDGEVLRAAGMLGAYAAAVPLVLGDVDNDHVFAGALVAGGVAGLALGDRLLAGRDFSPGQGVMVELSTLAGSLVGAGLGYMVAPDDAVSDTADKVLATSALLGGAAGFALAYLGLDTKVAPKRDAGFTFQLTPDLRPDHRGLAVAGSF